MSKIRRRYKKLTGNERDLLALWKAEEKSNKECARRLGRNVSTIGRELKRNSFLGKHYVAIHAQRRASERQQKVAHSKKPLKNSDLYSCIIESLRDGWSPDSIAGRLKRENPNDKRFWITAETIYRWIYQKEQIKKGWYEYLRRKQKKRKRRNGRHVHKANIPDRISIHQRSKAVNQRKEFGHWEGDTVEGKAHKNGIHTEVERMSRKIIGAKVLSMASKETIKVQKELFENLPKPARNSTTLDNGKENHFHYELKDIDMSTYFADPYSAFQRGTNEHGNWLLRYYFPKGTDFSKVSDYELQEVINEINNRPRKILGYQTANEVFQELLNQQNKGGVAINS